MSSIVIELSHLFAQFGIPDVLVTDNGSRFIGKEFEMFPSKMASSMTVTSAPFNLATIGLAECAMQIVKKGLEKEKGDTMASRIGKVLMAYCTISQSTPGVSSSEFLQGRRICTHLDLLKPSVTEHIEQHQLQQKLSHDSLACGQYFSKGEMVYAQNVGTELSLQLFKESRDQSHFFV